MLSELWLDHCKLGALPERMPHLKTLKVHARACERGGCARNVSLGSAQTLHLSANEIDALPRTFFGNLRLLEELSLDKNR